MSSDGTQFAFTVTSEEGATFTPWTDGRAVGFKVEAAGKPTQYVYLNPSGGTDTHNINDSDVFLYHGSTGDDGEPVCFVNIWNEMTGEVTP
jgi:hypothetical protein